MEVLLIILCTVTCLVSLITLYIVLKKNKDNNSTREMTHEITEAVRREISTEQSALRQELSAQTHSSVKNMGDLLSENQRDFSRSQYERMRSLEDRMDAFIKLNDQNLEQIRVALDKRLETMQQENNRQLDEMRKTVDERLEKSLEDKMNKSFSLVSQRLEQVYKGLGEMQNLATGVGDLKKVLSNVKTRGILGEIQLGSILSEILSPEQYAENVATKKGSKNVVEFAVKLPARDDGFIWLPIDSKFPGDTYAALREAIDNGDKAQIDDPPNTTEFAIMFLPFEGLYSEVVNRGMVEVLQREYKVNIAGPSTMAALLNSIQMGFKTLAVQKRSAEVWQVLGSVKKEFDTFAKVLESTQKRLDQANKDLDTLVGVRTRQIQRKLKDVETPTELLPDLE